MMENRTVLLVDDHTMVRAGLRSLVDQIAGFAVVAEASAADEAVSKLKEFSPNIVITDIDLGKDDGLDLVRLVKRQSPKTLVIILSMHASERLVSEALSLGAAAYLVKEAAPGELEIALKAAVRGNKFLSPAVSTRMIDRFMQPPGAGRTGLESLTPRQVQILTRFAQGMTPKEIAYELDLSEKTVSAHRIQLMNRLGVKDLIGLALFAAEHGLVTADRR